MHWILQSETVARPSVTVDLCHANLRSFLSPSFKYLSFLSPIPEVSPVSAELVPSKSNSIHGNAMDEIQQYPSRTPLQAVKGGKWFLTKCMDAMESMIMAEPAPSMSFLDCTMESSVLKLEGDAVNKSESRLPQLRSHVKVTPEVEESAEKSGAGGADASVESRDTNSCFSSQQNLGSINLKKQQLLKSSANVEVPSSSVLNSTYNLSNSEKSSQGQDLLVAEAGNTTVEVASVADPTANQASSNNTLVLHTGPSVTGRNLTIDITDRSTVGPTTEAPDTQMLRKNSEDTVELQSGTMARPNVTVDITDRSGFGVSLQGSAGSLGRKNGTFEIDPDSAHEPTRAPNLTVNLTTTNVSGPKTGSGDLQPGQSNEPATGQKLTCSTSKQLDFEADLAGVSEFEAGADGKLAPLTEAGNCDGDCNQNMCMENPEECSQMSFDTSLDMKPNFLITSTPLVAPKVFSFAAKAAPSDSCSMRSVLGRCEASSNGNDGSAPPQIDQPPPASARPPTKSLAIPTSLPLKCSAMTRPSNRKMLAFPSAIPKSHHTISRPPSSLLAPPPRTLSGLQVPGTSSLLSSTQSRIGRRTGGATRNTTASNPLEASVGSTINRRRQSVSENKPPIPGLLKPPVPSQPSASSVISQLALRPSGQAKPKLLTHRAAASSASRGSSESHMKGTQLPASSAKQPRGNTEETQPLSKRKRVDTLVHPAPSQTTGPPAGNQKGIRKPASLLRAPQSRLQSLGDQTSGILATKKSVASNTIFIFNPSLSPPAPLPPDLQPAAAQTDCKNCAKYRLEIARLRAELQEKGQMNS
ncbi:hypothetical protein GJAV_G00232240 [Gymnothorax javanicus]|nr:hypothetical protein GJAV_G00232240 [Gymnothorax javanicus]